MLDLNRVIAHLALVLAAILPGSPVAAADVTSASKERCQQLVAFFDRYGVSRSEHSDGARNHYRIRAAISCEGGQCDFCVREMETLLTRKAFDIPAIVGPPPFFEPSGRTPLGPAP